MYLKSKWITFLKVKNRILLLFGLFGFFKGIWDIVSLIVYYWGDWNTVIHARPTPESIVMIIIGTAILLYISFSITQIKNAAFYSSYFEGNLYGDITFEELSEVTGYSVNKIKLSMYFLRFVYMKNFSFRKNDSEKYIELQSKTVVCSCRSCGAEIDKKIYFSGICPYCKTSDVFAAVLTDNKIYSIESEYSKEKKSPDYYICKYFNLRKVMFGISLALALSVFLIIGMVLITYIVNYNDHEYLKQELLSGRSYSSYELIKKNMMNTIIFCIFVMFMLFPVMSLSFKKLIQLFAAEKYAEKFVRTSSPFFDVGKSVKNKDNVRKEIKKIRRIIQSRYLRNCSIEKHGKSLKIAFAKKIVKDKCPHCGAPITGAVDEKYVCNFCKNSVMSVIVKK